MHHRSPVSSSSEFWYRYCRLRPGPRCGPSYNASSHGYRRSCSTPSSALYGVVTYSRIRMSQMALVADDPDDPRTVEFDCDFVHYGVEGRRLRV